MKKTLLLTGFIFCLIGLNAQVLQQSMYIDFGNGDGTNGEVTTNPDVNASYWNNATNPATSAPAIVLVNKANVSTGYNMTVTTAMSVNASKNGLLGPTAQNLADLAIQTATEDYFYSANPGGLKFSGLRVDRGYVFKIFGARGWDTSQYSNRKGLFSLTGSNTTSGELAFCDLTYGQNYKNTYTSSGVVPNASGEITLTISSLVSGANWHMNCMKIDEYTLPSTGIENESAPSIKIYPTVFNAEITVVGATELIEIYNVTGNKVATQQASDETIIHTENLSKGIYLLVVDKKSSYKVVK